MAEKVTIMVLKVDLECTKCYRKVKKLLCKYPQIRDQVYNEKANTVTITVVCCSPEKIRDKLCCKGRGTIKSIDIKQPEPEKKKEPEKKAEPEKKKEPEKKAEPEKKKEPEKKAEPEKKKEPEKKAEPEKKKAEPEPERVPIGYPYPAHGAACCGPCYEGRPGGPCFSGYGMPMPPPPCNCGCGGGRSVCYNNGYTVNRCDYFSEENQAGCTVM